MVIDLLRILEKWTLVKAYDPAVLRDWMFRWTLKESSSRIESSGKMAVDATSFNRHWASRYYTKRTEISLSALKVTIRADVDDMFDVRDVHLTNIRKHDTQILPKLISKDEPVSFLVGDEEYEQENLPDWRLREGIRPLIKQREFCPLDKTANEGMKDAEYNHRQKVESVFSSVIRIWMSKNECDAVRLGIVELPPSVSFVAQMME